MVGTSSYPFTRLIEEMDQIACHCDQEVVIQIGYNAYHAKYAKTVPFIVGDAFENIINSNSSIFR